MCGITGEIRFNSGIADSYLVQDMTQRLTRRGPDGFGIASYDNIAFGQRRLKIFDLTPRGQQPMIDPELGLCMVFNGAIYNYKELRLELQNKGYKFFSNSDSEIVLKAYHCYGLDMLSKLYGMFAFVIWERDTNKVVIARDRLGIKPLYYIHNEQYFRFASTLPALLMDKEFKREIDPTALHYYLTFHAVPEPLTLIKDIKKLEPGTAMILNGDNGDIKTHRYWELIFDEEYEEKNKTDSQWVEELEEVFTNAIKRRLVADVPVGILLSGGLDSSLLVGLIAKATNKTVPTFSIGFESKTEKHGDEFYYSDIIAKHFATDHKLYIENANVFDSLEQCVFAMSEPMTSHDNIAFYLLSKEVSKYAKVVQSGQGADELFAGYHWFQTLKNKKATSKNAEEILSATISDYSYKQYEEIISKDYLTNNHAQEFLNKLCSRIKSDSLLHHTLTYESGFALTNGPLARVDNMTMSWGLEGRVPFLDHEVAEFSTRLPTKFKVNDGGKHILKKLARGIIPDEVIDRPKGYFPVPALEHIGEKEINWLNEVASKEKIKKRGLFNSDYIDKIFANPKDYRTNLGASKLWQIVLLEYWLQVNQIQ